MAPGQTFHRIHVEIQDAVAVVLIHWAGLRIFLYFQCIPHHITDIDNQKNCENQQTVADAGENRQARDPLGYADGKCVGTSCAVTRADGSKDNRYGGHGVKSHSKADGEDQGKESQIFLVVGRKSSATAEDDHTDGNQKKFPALHLSDEGGHARLNRAGGFHNTKGAADDKQEGDNAASALDSQCNRFEHVKQADGTLGYVMEGAWIHYHTSGAGVFDPVKHAGRYEIAGQGADKDNACNNNDWIGSLKSFLASVTFFGSDRSGFTHVFPPL